MFIFNVLFLITRISYIREINFDSIYHVKNKKLHVLKIGHSEKKVLKAIQLKIKKYVIYMCFVDKKNDCFSIKSIVNVKKKKNTFQMHPSTIIPQ